MITNMLKLGAAIAWAGAAVSSSAPASAVVVSQSTGSYATCTNNTYAYATSFCGYTFNYYQLIRFNEVACSTGGCTQETFPTFVEYAYSTGRKTATLITLSCAQNPGYNVYGVGSCGC
jgi:hypothetical protein